MGYGGDLIWSGVFRALRAHDGRPVLIANTPKLSDILAGRLYDRSANLADRTVFAGNPNVIFPAVVSKPAALRWLDTAFAALLKGTSLRRAYERWVVGRAIRRTSVDAPRMVHVDMLIHSYAERETRKNFVWKKGGHAIATVSRGFGVLPESVRPELYLADSERRRVADIVAQSGISSPYVVLEPDSNREWFGDLRAWPRERWIALATRLRNARPDITLVQVGVPDSPTIPSAVDLRGQTTFREAAAVIQNSALFIGTEGGLMHAARAVDARAVILWGGVTLPEFAGYPDSHRIVCHRVSCAPCGQFGWCDNGHICMREITVEETLSAVLDCLGSSNR